MQVVPSYVIPALFWLSKLKQIKYFYFRQFWLNWWLPVHIEHQSTLWVKHFLQQTLKGPNCSCELLMSRQAHHKCHFHSIHPPTTSAGISSPWKQKQLLEHKNDPSRWNVEQKKSVSIYKGRNCSHLPKSTAISWLPTLFLPSVLPSPHHLVQRK